MAVMEVVGRMVLSSLFLFAANCVVLALWLSASTASALTSVSDSGAGVGPSAQAESSSWSIPFLDLPPVTSLSWQWSDLARVPSLWWQHYLGLWQREPQHVLIELICGVAIVYLILRSPDESNKKHEKLSRVEEDELIRSWEPQPLAPPLAKQVQPKRKHVLQSVSGARVVLNGGDYLNWTSFNFLGYAGNSHVEDECRRTIDKYGVGSCGPRGFYGTFDVHLEIEERVAKLFGADGCILYSDGIACLASVIPAFAKRGDLLVVDERVNYGIQQGVQLSRSNVLYYKHNDLDDLKRVLDSVVESDVRKGVTTVTNRRFIVTEGVFQNSGEITPLDKLIELKKRYKYRLILDDSIGFGVLGSSGKGSVEHFNAKITDVDMYCGTLDLAMATAGGFCVADQHIVSHQRLSGAGYCFSASSPPYAVMAGIVALELLQSDPQPSQRCRDNAKRMRAALANFKIPAMQIIGGALTVSPVIHLRPILHTTPTRTPPTPSTRAAGTVTAAHSASSSATAASASSLSAQRDLEQQFVDRVSESLYTSGVIVDVPAYIPSERIAPTPSIRILVCAHHSDGDIQRTAQLIADAWKAAAAAHTL